MFNLIIEYNFPSSHQLKLSKGKEPIHSHTWRLRLYITPIKKKNVLDSHAFILVKNYLKDILSPFEKKSFNTCSYFKKINPSTENIAQFIFTKLEDLSLLMGFKPIKVSLWETEDFCASWIGE